MSESAATTEQKQRYLREQILEQKYDAQEFVSFLCKDLNIEELDVEHINMPTLQSIVLKFKQYKYYQQPIQQPKQKKVKIEYEKQLYDYEFEAKWKCIHAEPLVDPLEVFVPSFEVKQTEGLFFSIGSRTQVWFVVQSTASKAPVRRLNDDFQWLSDTVARVFPLLAVPELLGIGKEQGNHAKRRRELEQYIQLLAKRIELRSSNLLIDFLSLPQEKMEKLRKSWDSMGFAKGVQSVKNQQGYVSVYFTNKLRNFALGSVQFNRRAQAVQQAIAGALQRLGALHGAAAEELNKIVEHFAELHEVYGELTNRSPEQKVHEYNQVLVNLNNLYHIMAEDLAARARVFAAHLKDFHKLQLNYGRSLNRLSRSLSDAEKDYVYLKTNLTRKKQRLYPDVSKWQVEEKLLQNRRLTKQEAFGLMLPKQTQQEQEMRDWLAYLYTNYRLQFQRYVGSEVDRHVSTYATLVSELLLNNRTYVEELTKFVQDCRKTEEARKTQEDKRAIELKGRKTEEGKRESGR